MVLIIDDSVSIVQRLLEMLKEEEQVGRIEYVTSIADAKAFLKYTKPDVVLLDIHLSDGNGVDVLRHIKKDHPGIHVIMFTNEVNDYYKDLCKRLGACHFADKSKDFTTLSAVINSLN